MVAFHGTQRAKKMPDDSSTSHTTVVIVHIFLCRCHGRQHQIPSLPQPESSAEHGWPRGLDACTAALFYLFYPGPCYASNFISHEFNAASILVPLRLVVLSVVVTSFIPINILNVNPEEPHMRELITDRHVSAQAQSQCVDQGGKDLKIGM